MFRFVSASSASIATLSEILQAAEDPSRGVEAREMFESALSSEPSLVLRQNFAVFLFKSGSTDLAVTQLELATTEHPAAETALNMLADLYKRKGDHKKGVALLREVLKRDGPVVALCRQNPKWAMQACEDGMVASVERCAQVLDDEGLSVEAERIMLNLLERAPPTKALLHTLDVIQYRIHEDRPSDGYLQRLAATRAASRSLAPRPASVDAWRQVVASLPSKAAPHPPIGDDHPFASYTRCKTVQASDLNEYSFEATVKKSQAVVVTGLRVWPVEGPTMRDYHDMFGGDLVIDVDLLHADGSVNKLFQLNDRWKKELQPLTDVSKANYGHVRPAKTYMYASDFLKALGSHELPQHVHLFANQQDVNASYPGFAATLPSDLLPFASSAARRLVWRNLWLGGASKTPLHFDGKDNVIFMLNGTKHILLLPPTAYEELGISQLHDVFPSEVDSLSAVKAWMSGKRLKGRRRWKRVGLDKVRPAVNHTHPRGRLGQKFMSWARDNACFAQVSRGMALVIPIFWLHAVHSHPNSDSITAAINYWYKPVHELGESIALHRSIQ